MFTVTTNSARGDDDSIESYRTEKSSPSRQRHSSENAKNIQATLAAKEQRNVALSKYAMICVLALVAIGLSVTTYVIVRKEEVHDFESKFEAQAREIIIASTVNIESTFLAMETFATSTTSYAKDTGMKWPNVTIGAFAAKALDTVEAAGGGTLQLANFVNQEERLGFEEYAYGEVFSQTQEVFDYLGVPQNSSDIDFVDTITYINYATGQRITEPYSGEEGASDLFLVNWQMSYVLPHFIMNNMLSSPTLGSVANQVIISKGPGIGFFNNSDPDDSMSITAQVMQPVFQDVFPASEANQREVVALLLLASDWRSFFQNILGEGAVGSRVVLESSCGFVETYQINGPDVERIGAGDIHDPKYEHMEIATVFYNVGEPDESFPDEFCFDEITLHIYATEEMRESLRTSRPYVYASIVAGIFVCTSAMFFVYDFAVRNRQNQVMKRVIAQDKIVSNLFPETIRDRLYKVGDGGGQSDTNSVGTNPTDFGGNNPEVFGSKPIADLFLETTVLFADIVGFTAWSSAREPSQVFILLERIYGAFDKICNRRGVFKVETIGDCYVAVTGLPLPNKNHAVVMAKFARDCMAKMKALTTKMEIDLGPDTGDLDIRIGLHSGQVTAGVLRGERSRFQLFGDTVNVAARMESSGERGRIHISGATAELVKSSGYTKWVHHRGGVLIRGKGTMDTFWLETYEETRVRNDAAQKADGIDMMRRKGGFVPPSIQSLATTESDESPEDALDVEEEYEKSLKLNKKQRLVEWNVEILCGLLKRVLAARTSKARSLKTAERSLVQQETVLEEFEEIITLPRLTLNDLKQRKDPEFVMLDSGVVEQLRAYLTQISNMYRDNHFHSFEHASHVTASVAKLLSRIVTSDSTQQTHGPSDLEETDLAGHSYGITSDPLTQFAVVFSAIIHDVDHQGVPNAQLVREDDPLVARYKGKSLAEQNSVDLAWEVLMLDKYADLRACIYSNETELKRFRQLLVNMVMATDIADKELGALRKARWNKAFEPSPGQKDSAELVLNRKATIVLEHLIQASDVSHTMQHWQVYKKWNKKFFDECYSAWKSGRSEQDPSIGWYKGEIGFFNFYIIPLAKKLDSCGVFGVSSHEYLNYAVANLEEWTKTGEHVVEEFVTEYESSHSH